MDGQALLGMAWPGVGVRYPCALGATTGTAWSCPCRVRDPSSQDSGRTPHRRGSDTAGRSTELTTHVPLAHQLCPQTGPSSGPQTSVDLSSGEPVILGSEVKSQGPKEVSSFQLRGRESP